LSHCSKNKLASTLAFCSLKKFVMLYYRVRAGAGASQKLYPGAFKNNAAPQHCVLVKEKTP
jgi:hypothetical protein